MLQLHKNDFRTHLDYFQTLWTMFVLSFGCHLFSIPFIFVVSIIQKLLSVKINLGT